MKITVPKNIITVLSLLEKAGFEAYAVGGCVRDSLLGREPYDWDVCTSAKPEETMTVFKAYHTIPTGVKHGTVTVIVNEAVEITTFRIDGEYADNRRPDSVKFTEKLKDDLCRRDFTVNAMAADKHGTVFDFYGGCEDLNNRLIRCAGEPEKRFDEDALRIIRGLRFAATLGFDIEKKTAAAITAKSSLLKKIAVERVTAEMKKLIFGNCADVLCEFAAVFNVFMPEVKITRELAIQTEKAPKSLEIRLAVLLQNLSAENGVRLLRNLRFANITVKAVEQLLENKATAVAASKPCLKHIMNKLGFDGTKRLLLFKSAIGMCEDAEKISALVDEIEIKQECYTLSRLAVKGSDLSAAGVPDKHIGKTLHKLLELVMAGEAANEKTELLDKLFTQIPLL